MAIGGWTKFYGKATYTVHTVFLITMTSPHIELQLNLILEKKDISGSTSNRSQTFMSIINWRYNLITFMAFWAIGLFLLFKQSLTLLEGDRWLSWIKVFLSGNFADDIRFCAPAQSWMLVIQRYQKKTKKAK